MTAPDDHKKSAAKTFGKQAARPKKEKQRDPNIAQREASDPASSVWVTASAGTGKTKVLTDRVLRLMLDGAKPEEILCLTFTKAAASVMTIRIRDELSSWATMNDDALAARLMKLTGKRADDAQMDRARRLFAEFLDAHGGLRIQTIHAFSQSLIRRFPVETGIPPYFDVMDDQTAADLLRQARADILRGIKPEDNSPLARAVRMITPEVNEDDFNALISQLTYRRGELLSIFAQQGGLEDTISNVYDYLGAEQGADSKTLNEELNSDSGLYGDAPDMAALNAAADMLATGTPTELEKAKMIKAWMLHPEQRVELFWDYASVFLTADGEMRKKLTTKKTEGALETMQAEAERLMRGIEAISTMNVARGTESVLRLTGAILENYTTRKKALNLLDYDDLIHAANVMMKQDNAAGWVLQKLPGNLKHMLVDEAQDTNPDQWALISAIVKEFFTGEAQQAGQKPGQKPGQKKDNTLFVVGDEKQSIFSFQRADPREFARRKKFFAKLVAENGGKWREVEMDIAFRSSPAITRAVDAVFANPAASDGLFARDAEDDKKVSHDPFRKGQAGLVELHPLLIAAEKEDPAPWTLPLETEEKRDTAVDMAEKIADQIKGWLDSGERLESRNRPISPADIMILVRRRSDFVDHMVRALKKRDVPVAGADRMSLRDQIVVMDMVALGECMLFTRDDYKLACVLKSPLLGLDDKQLETVAASRSGTLWDSLREKASLDKADAGIKAAYEYLDGLAKTVTTARPYEFYSSVLMNGCPGNDKSGLNALYGRLGFEAEDPLVEFMNAVERFEKGHPPSLQEFLSWLDAGEAEVKREINLNPESPRVHIMTVHGAKGLEAPIVILPDTTGLPEDNTRARPKFLWPDRDRAVPLWVPRADLENNAFRRERQQAEGERDREFRRLLYVAMTRAADRLYVHGYQNSGRQTDESWYALIKKGLEEHLKDDVVLDEDTGILRFGVAQTARPQNDGVSQQQKRRLVGIPEWARTLPKPDDTPAIGRFKPSDYKANNDNGYAAPSPLTAETEKYHATLGDVVHALLEILPALPPEERGEAMRKYLAKPVWKITPQDQISTAAQLTSVLAHPDFAALFGPDSRAEVTIRGVLEKGGQKQVMSGQIDRLVIEKDSVTIVDYKNAQRVPSKPESVVKKYLVQMASYRMALQKMYPEKEIKCALLWTRTAQLMPLPPALLDKTLNDVGVKPIAKAVPERKRKK